MQARLNETAALVYKAMHAYAHRGKMQMSIYDIQNKEHDLEDRETALEQYIQRVEGELPRKVDVGMLNALPKMADIERLKKELDNVSESVGEMKLSIMDELGAKSENEANELRQKLAEIAGDVAKTLGSLDGVRKDVGEKAANKEVTAAMESVKERLQMLANNTYPREGLERALEQKFDKKDLATLTEALKGGGQTIDLGKPFFAVYTCKKPFKPPGLTGLYAGEISTLEESQSVPGGLNMDSLMSSSLDGSATIGLPDVNQRPATTMATGGSVRSAGPATQSAYDQDPVEDGSSVGRYPRMMPPPVRIRTAAGGGGISGSLAGVPRRMKMPPGSGRSSFSR